MQGSKILAFYQSKLVILTSILLLVIKVLISYEPVFDSLQYIELGTNFIQNAKYHLDGFPNRFSPTVPFWYGLVFIKDNLSLSLILVGFVSIFHFLLTICVVYKTFKMLGIDSRKIVLVLLLFVTNTHVFSWTGMLYPESFLGLYFWLFMYYIVKNEKSKEDWFLLGLTYTILCISKLVFLPLILVILVYLIFYKCNISKFLAVTSFCFGTLLLAFYIKYYCSVLLPDVSKLFDFDYGATRFDGDFKETLMKGLGFLPFKPGLRVDGIPSLINVLIPQTGLRSWWMSILLIALLVLPLIWQKRQNNFKILKLLIAVLLVVLISFVSAGTGFPRYWIPVFPILFLLFLNSVDFVVDKMKTHYKLTSLIAYTVVYAHLLNDLRILIFDVI